MSMTATAIRRAHAVPTSTEPGFQGVPAPAYNGKVEDVKGKQREAPQTASKPAAPRRKIEIKAKKAAISMVRRLHMPHPINCS